MVELKSVPSLVLGEMSVTYYGILLYHWLVYYT